MKKIFLLVILALFICTIARAESIPNFYDYTKNSFGWYATIYNNTNKVISSNTVVSLDMSIASKTVEGFAAYASQKSCTGYVAVLGVADEDIASKTLGRICVRGPHQVKTVATSGREGDTGSSYPRKGNWVITTGSPIVQPVGIKESQVGAVVNASPSYVSGVTNYGCSVVGYRIGIDANPATNTQEDLIWIWVQPGPFVTNYNNTTQY